MPDKTIMLTKGEGYNVQKAGLIVQRGVPFTVDASIADELLHLGFFSEVSPDDGDPLLDDLFERVGAIHIPKNTLDGDDLNGKHVLLRRHGAIGDVMFVVVFAQLLKAKYPDCHITMAVLQGQVSYVTVFDCVDEVIDLDISSRANVVQTFDYIISFTGVVEEVNPETTDYFVLHKNRAQYAPDLPEKMPRVGISKITQHLRVQEDAAMHRRQAGLKDDDEYVILLTGTSNPLKRLNVESLQLIADRLSTGQSDGLTSEKTGRGARNKKTSDPRKIRVLCMGDKQDRVLSATNPFISFIIDAPLPVCVELIRKSLCVIGADTGLLHTAAAIGVPTVSVWGPTNPSFTILDYEGNHIAITASAEKGTEVGSVPVTEPGADVEVIHSAHQHCSPCGRLRAAHCSFYTGGYADCMKHLDTEVIINSVYKLITKPENKEHPARMLAPAAVITPKGSTAIAQTTSDFNVAVLFDCSDHYTGGGFYVWSLVKNLAATAGTVVHVYYDRPEMIYRQDNPDLSNVQLIQCPALEKWESKDVKYDLVIGTPPVTGVNAVAYAQKNKEAKSMLLVYETPGYIREYRKGIDGHESYWQEYKDALLQATAILCISELVREKLLEWCPALEGVVHIVHPCIADSTAATYCKEVTFAPGMRMDQVVLIARNEKYKGLRETLAAIVKDFAIPRNIPLNVVVVGHGATKLQKIVDASWEQKGIHVTLRDSVTENEKWEILTKSKALIHSSEFEGFGIPLAEAAYAGTPIVCHPLEIFENCFPGVPEATYTTDTELAKALTNIFDAWRDHAAGKSVEMVADLKQRRGIVKSYYVEKAQSKTLLKALRKIDVKLSVLKKSADAMPEVVTEEANQTKVAVISTYNTRCGIAETTKDYLTQSKCIYRILAPIEPEAALLIPDGPEVHRCWTRGMDVDAAMALADEVENFGAEVVHIHHEFSFFSEASLFAFLTRMREKGIRSVITLHTFLVSGFTDRLEKLADIIVLAKPQENLADVYRVIGLACPPLIDLPRYDLREKYGLKKSSFVVGAFGFWQEHKGYMELLQAYNSIAEYCGESTQILIVGYSAPKSMYASEVRRSVKPLLDTGQIVLCTDYLEMDEIQKRISCCDALVFNYNIFAYSSASAAVRTGMSVSRPVVCTQSPMFSEFENEKHVLKVPFGNTLKLAEAISRVKDVDMANKLVKNSSAYISSCSVAAIAKQHDALYLELAKK